MLAILNSLNAHYLPIFQPILMILVSKFMFYKALSYKTYLLLGLLSPLTSRILDISVYLQVEWKPVFILVRWLRRSQLNWIFTVF